MMEAWQPPNHVFQRWKTDRFQSASRQPSLMVILVIRILIYALIYLFIFYLLTYVSSPHLINLNRSRLILLPNAAITPNVIESLSTTSVKRHCSLHLSTALCLYPSHHFS